MDKMDFEGAKEIFMVLNLLAILVLIFKSWYFVWGILILNIATLFFAHQAAEVLRKLLIAVEKIFEYVSRVLLFFIFLLVITPIGFLKRFIFKEERLRLKNSDTSWEEVNKEFSRESFERLY